MNSAQEQSLNAEIGEDGWAGILGETEEILWQGTPEPGLQIEYQSPLEFLTSALFFGIAFYWIIDTFRNGSDFGVPAFIFLAIGLYGLVFKHIWHAYVRKHTYYTLTDQRAIIATSVPYLRKKLNSYDITPSSKLEYIEGRFGKIIFLESVRQASSRDYIVKIGFERLADGRDVYKLMRKLQNAGAE